MKEYGTNVQKLLDYILTIGDREKRTKYAYLLTELMRQIHPAMRDQQDYSNKLWDDLYVLSGFKLDVDSPYPPPPADAVGKRPKPVPYNTNTMRFKHYGKNVELLVKRAIEAENEEEKLITTAYLCRLMKSFYLTWNKDIVDDHVIFTQLADLSKGKLNDTLEIVKAEGLMDGNMKFARNNNNNNTNTNNRNNYGKNNFNNRNKPNNNNNNKNNINRNNKNK